MVKRFFAMKIRNSSRQNAEKSGLEVENKGAKEYIIKNVFSTIKTKTQEKTK